MWLEWVFFFSAQMIPSRRFSKSVNMTMIKIFQIGFNKCATTSLHRMVAASGYKSVHWANGSLAKQLYINQTTGRPILSGIDGFDCYTDMESPSLLLFGHRYFRELYAEYPNAYFVLNTRNKRDWLVSRSKHKKGYLLKTFCQQFNLTPREVVQYWSLEWDKHHRDVRQFFAGQGNLLEFNVDSDSVDKLIDFCRPTFQLDSQFWGQHNTTESKEKRTS